MPSTLSNLNESLVLRDLQSMLQKTVDKNLTVINYEALPLLCKGENFAATMLKIIANIKRNKDSPEEKLHLVAKMICLAPAFDNTVAFVKEIFVFEQLMPAYRQLERDVGIKEDEMIDVLPKFFGGRLNLNGYTPFKADSDAVLLMQNLNVDGYYPLGRHAGILYFL